jgi:hypothetical protein
MPVSKKRKKDGKPVHRAAAKPAPAPEGGEHPVAPEAKETHARTRAGRPANPFVAQQQSKRGAQRGR